MKHILTILLFSFFALSGQAQIVFESNLDNWNDSLPNDWQGTNRVFIADSVIQWTSSPQYGSAAAELVNEFGAPRILASTNVTLELGVFYDVEVWARGYGQLRAGIFDGETSDGDGGFSPWGPFVTFNSDDVTSFVQQFSPEQTTNLAEILISANNGTVILDRVEVRVGVAPTIAAVSIIEIQSDVVLGGASSYVDSTLQISGVVSAVGQFEYFLQEAPGEWGGILVSDFGNTPAIGDEVQLQGTIFEFDGVTQLAAVTSYEVISSGNTPEAVFVDNNSLNTESYESVLVRTTGNCAALPASGFWLITDGVGLLKIGQNWYAFTPVLNDFYDVTGIMRFDVSSSQFQLDPRFADDVLTAVGIEELSSESLSIYPNPVQADLNISVSESSLGARVLIIDTKGAVQHTSLITTPVMSIDLSGWASGEYILLVQSQSEILSGKKFIVD